MYESKKQIRILSIDPSTRGLGFAIMEGPDNLIDWGVKQVKVNKNERCLMLVADLIERYQPDTVVLEDCADINCRRAPRVKELIRNMSKLADRRGIRIQNYSRNAVRSAFSQFGALTKHQIAAVIADQLPELAPKMPPFRKLWMSEDDRMSIFNAVALAFTFFHFKLGPVTRA
jgi:Holliday junction resolvasome RuvABC endonuclease subunit